jgi:serine/threonine protein kinase
MAFHELYTLGPAIGQGGFATVHRCTHKVTGEIWAVKISRKRALLPHDVVHAQTEAKILQTLSHPRILKVTDVFETDSMLLMVMELVEGGPLFHKIVELDCYTEETASKLMQNILQGVEYLHSCGVAHRDLKPENLILVGSHDPSDGLEVLLTRIKIIDFGFAQRFTPGVPSFTDGVGSLAYLAPEIVRIMRGGPREPYDEKVDIWACGVICFILLSGCFPFMADTVNDTYRYILDGNFAFSKAVWTTITPHAKEFIQRLLTVDPASRPTATQALKEPWIIGHPELPPAYASKHLVATVQRLHDFNLRNRKVRMAGCSMATRPGQFCYLATTPNHLECCLS